MYSHTTQKIAKTRIKSLIDRIQKIRQTAAQAPRRLETVPTNAPLGAEMASKEEIDAMKKEASEMEAKLEKMLADKVSLPPSTPLFRCELAYSALATRTLGHG